LSAKALWGGGVSSTFYRWLHHVKIVPCRRLPRGIWCLAGWDEAGNAAVRPWLLTYLADTCRMAGNFERGLGHLVEARRDAEQAHQLMYLAETLRLTGEVRLAMDEPAAAETRYLEALAVARQQNAKL
jgi:hypothetical protein